jgi:hypothetical protein
LVITFVNKIVLTSYNFKSYANILTLGQLVTGVGALLAFRSAGVVSFANFDRRTAVVVMPLFFTHVINVVSGLTAMG